MIIRNIAHKNGKVRLEICVNPKHPKTDSIPEFKDAILQDLPGLKYHTCHNDSGFCFTQELENTELAHAFEHILIEKIAQLDPEAKSLKGWTEWNWTKYPKYSYQVEIDYENPEIFTAALSQAYELTKKAIEQKDAPIPATV